MQLVNLVFCVISLVLLAGCGGSSSTGSPHAVSTAAASATCLDCHASAVSPGTGALIAAEWGTSTHNLNNGASCADCHEPPANHPNNACSACHGGGTGEVTQNPDAAGKCLKCHGPAHPSDIMMVKAPQHYGYSSATVQGQAKRASFVSGRYVGDCRACHNPHLNTVTPQHRAWAGSAHGDPKGVAWSSNDFTVASRALCSRCHTATGYLSYVTSNFTVPSTAAGTGDGSRQLLACNACHTSYDFKNIRQVASFTAPYKGYNGSDLASFPAVGETNLCIPCHTGRESGHSLDAVPNFASANFINPHYLAAAGLMYMQSGFTGFTSASAVIGSSTYGKSLSPDSISTPGGMSGGTTSTHRNLGTTRINNDSHKPSFFVPGVADSNGPCVTCHLNASGVAVRAANGHSLKIDDNAYNQLCTNCHSSENTVPLNAANFRSVFLEPQAEAFQSTLELAVYLLKDRYNVEYDPALYPYFFVGGQTHSSASAVKDWTISGTRNGKKMMGACFNVQLLTKDPAAFAHARSYSRRLLYDSIDFIDDGIMNGSTGTTAQTVSASGSALTNPVFGKFTKGAKAYDSAFDSTTNGVTKYVITTIASGTSEAMLYLVGWSRSGSDADPATAAAKAGAWNSPERP
ncbi:C-type polyheme cytochrome OmcB [Geomonas silvestris]|uniref:C-type polyheme cytochrome OmcB n=1 Tax=Geomonas silvestris TaxID=2740184 RepID=A0A6V8MMN6_9BACT|nr:hypothetical protein [Geomonas silvestris]GFO61278.1 C-type polyheme cytochrome OmcB [Geomonas silvestris]